MEVSTLRYSGGIGLHGRSPLLRLQSDERLIALIRRGNSVAFEVLVSRYHSRLLAFCRHLLGSKEDAEDVLQEVFAAAFNAILADERTINVRPWLYRIARNRSLNHLRRIQAIGVDSMDVHFSEFGATTADKVHDREQFRLLVTDIQSLPETQRTALVLREMDALSYEQIAEAMDTTVPGVKSLLVRARISLAEAAEARQLSCDEVRIELAEVAEGLRKRPPALVRRHLRACSRCSTFHGELKQTNKVLAALLPIGPVAMLRQLLLAHLGSSAGTGSGATAGAASAGGAASGAGGLAAGTTGGGAVFGSAGSLMSAGAGALASKAAAGLAAAALMTAGAVEVTHMTHRPQHPGDIATAARPAYSSAPAKVSINLHASDAGTSAPRPAKPSLAAASVAPKTAGNPTPPTSSTTPVPPIGPQQPGAGPTASAPTDHAGDTGSRVVQNEDPTVLSGSNGGNSSDTGTTSTTTTTTTTTTSGSDGSGSPPTTTTSGSCGSGSGAASGSSGGASPTPASSQSSGSDAGSGSCPSGSPGS